MSTITEAPDAHRFSEGGLFYPTGYLLVAFPSAADALKVQADLVSGGYEATHDCVYATPAVMANESAAEVRHSGMLALLGHSLQAREAHLDLARKGCHFLTIHASTRIEMERVIRVLTRVPVRYAIKYNMLVIENITEQIQSAVTEAEAT